MGHRNNCRDEIVTPARDSSPHSLLITGWSRLKYLLSKLKQGPEGIAF